MGERDRRKNRERSSIRIQSSTSGDSHSMCTRRYEEHTYSVWWSRQRRWRRRRRQQGVYVCRTECRFVSFVSIGFHAESMSITSARKNRSMLLVLFHLVRSVSHVHRMLLNQRRWWHWGSLCLSPIVVVGFAAKQKQQSAQNRQLRFSSELVS